MEFWKVGSRKLFAVTKASLDDHRGKVLKLSSSSTGSSTKRRRSKDDQSVVDEMIENTLENLIEEVGDVRSELEKYRNLAFKHRFSLSFIASFEEAFKCSICQMSPSRPPLIACSACGTLVGCQSCTDEWYKEGSLAKQCPKCRSERGLTKTFVLRGFDEVVVQLRQLNNETDALDDTIPIAPPAEDL